MKSKEQILEKLKDFIIAEYWGERNKMNLKTRLEKDLKITGDDGIDIGFAALCSERPSGKSGKTGTQAQSMNKSALTIKGFFLK